MNAWKYEVYVKKTATQQQNIKNTNRKVIIQFQQ